MDEARGMRTCQRSFQGLALAVLLATLDPADVVLYSMLDVLFGRLAAVDNALAH